MKVINILWVSLLVCLTSCEEKSKEYTYENETTERVTCPICNGYGCNLCAQSGNGSVWIPVEEHITEIRKGSNVTFRGKTKTVYGYCNSGCGCKAYVPKGGGNEACASCAFYGCTTNKFGHKH